MLDVLRDVSYALRRLWSSRILSSAVVATLAVGIGGTAGVFSLVNGALLKPHPSARDPRVVKVSVTDRGRLNSVAVMLEPYLERLRERPPVHLSALGGMWQFETVVHASDEGRVVMGEAVCGEYFSLIGARLIRGRVLETGEPADVCGTHGSRQDRTAVISERLWRSAFGATEAVIGQTLTIGGYGYTIVGVLGGEVRGLVLGNLLPYDVWVPLHDAPMLSLNDKGSVGALIGRLAPGSSVAVAAAEMRVIGANLDPERPDLGLSIQPLADALFTGPPVFFVAAGGILLLCGLVFLGVVANLANLLLTNVLGRTHELAVRQMLGADRTRIVRLLSTETCLLVLGGLGLGWAGAVATTRTFHALPLAERAGLAGAIDATPDWRVFAAAFVAAAVAALAITGVLARQASNIDALQVTSARGGGGGSTSVGHAMGSRLVAIQIAVGLALLVSMGSVSRASSSLLRWEPGIRTDARVGRVALGLLGHTKPGLTELEQVVDVLRASPGVATAAVATGTPGQGRGIYGKLERPGHTALGLGIVAASPTFMDTVGLRLLRGRPLAHGSTPEVLLSERAVSLADLGSEPLGRTVRLGLADAETDAYVVGVLADVEDVTGTPQPFAVVPLTEEASQALFIVRGSAPAPVLDEHLRQAIHRVLPGVPVHDVGPLAGELVPHLHALRLLRIGLTCVATIAGAIAVLGVYSLAAYRIARRGREMGVRMALGATTAQLYRLLLRENATITVLGIVGGLLAAIFVGFIIGSVLPGVSVLDPVALGLASTVFLAAVLTATALPLRRMVAGTPSTHLRAL